MIKKGCLFLLTLVMLFSVFLTTALAGKECTSYVYKRIGATFCTTPVNCDGKGQFMTTWYENRQGSRTCIENGRKFTEYTSLEKRKIGCC